MNFKTQVADLLAENKAVDIVHLEVSSLTPLFDDMFVCTATSTRHASSMANHLIKHFKPQMPATPRAEGLESSEWILIDLNTVIVHIMLAQTRNFYSIEQLWQINSLTDKNVDNN